MDFRTAGNTTVTIGKYKGRSIDQVGSSDEGLLWLDWLRGMREKQGPQDELYQAICVYLDDQSIAKDLEKLTRGR
jgi:hypothetical protein